MTLTKRGTVYHLDTSLGDRRVRCSLGVSDGKAAERLANRVSFALADGPKSEVWGSLKQALPSGSFQKLTLGLRFTEPTAILDFEKAFYASLDRRRTLGELAPGSVNLYNGIAEKFFIWLHEQGVRKMDQITRSVVEDYLVERKKGTTRNQPLAQTTLVTEMRVLRIIFKLAVEEKVIKVSPLKDIRKIEEDEPNPVPFTADEILRMEKIPKTPHVDLIYKLFRHTGMRRGDIAELQWRAIDWDAKLLTWRTGKRGKQIIIPLVPELYKALEGEYLPDRNTVLGMGSARIYQTIKGIGAAAKVEDCFPHKFRTTLATSLLAKGATLFDVAAILGDTPATVDRYYGAHTAEQRERVRGIMEAA